MQNVILIGAIGRTDNQTTEPVHASAFGALARAVIDDTRGHATARAARKDFDTFAAKLACAGLELRIMSRAGSLPFYEVRRGAQARTCSTLHGVSGMLAALNELGGRP